MTQEAPSKDLFERPLSDLRVRAWLLNKIIEEAKAEGDMRYLNLVPDLNRLQAVIRKRTPPTVVGMKPADMKPRGEKLPPRGGNNGRG